MNKIIVAILVMFGMSPQFALASEKPSPFYAGVGLALLTNNHGIAISSEEAWFMSAPTTLSSGRTENNNELNGNAFLGYKFSENLSLELGYLGKGNAFTSLTTGTVKGNLPTIDGTLGASTVVPFSVTQRKKVTAWQISFIGEKPLNESISLFGRVGVMKSQTSWEQRIIYNCTQASCSPYQVLSSSSSKTTPLLGVGLAMKVSENASIRVEAMKSSALPSIATKVDLVFRF